MDMTNLEGSEGLTSPNLLPLHQVNPGKNVHVWDHSYSTSIQSVEENCTHDHSYVKKIHL